MAGIGTHSDTDLSITSSSYPMMEIAEEKRSKRNPTQLDFDSAMGEFGVMFPSMDPELIESVLRANHGAVDETIDQLLLMTNDKKSKNTEHKPPSLPPKPHSGSRSSNERLTDDDTSPALPPREGSLKRNKPKLANHSNLYNKPQTQYDTEWNGMIIPMLGKLPAEFLRLQVTDSPPPRPPKHLPTKQRSQSLKMQLPMHLAETQSRKKTVTLHTPPGASRGSHSLIQTQRNRQGHLTTNIGERLSSNMIKRQIEANQRRLQESCDASPGDHDSDSDRFLEDERLALIMQNEEFLRELKRNEDFMRTLEFERDMLASRLAEEQRKNRQLTHLPPTLERTPPNWMVPRPSERDDNSLPRSLSPSDLSSSNRGASLDRNSVFSSDSITPSSVPIDKTDKLDVHDFRDQLRSMGASSKKKFAVLAKKFFSASRKKRKAATKIVRDAHGPSTLNLLDDNDDEDLIDNSNGGGAERDTDVLFEPLPDAWTATPIGEESDNNTNDSFNERVWL